MLPGTLPVAELTRRLADSQGVVIMKLGRTFPAVVEALRRSGRLDEARYVERASTGTEVVRPVAEVDPASVPYFSLVLVPGRDRRADAAGRASTCPPCSACERRARDLLVVGLGPGPDRWVTPEVVRGPGTRSTTSSATAPTSTGCPTGPA